MGGMGNGGGRRAAGMHGVGAGGGWPRCDDFRATMILQHTKKRQELPFSVEYNGVLTNSAESRYENSLLTAANNL